eukprot:5931871-Pleurochrysis_carterae.AAC.1
MPLVRAPALPPAYRPIYGSIAYIGRDNQNQSQTGSENGFFNLLVIITYSCRFCPDCVVQKTRLLCTCGIVFAPRFKAGRGHRGHNTAHAFHEKAARTSRPRKTTHADAASSMRKTFGAVTGKREGRADVKKDACYVSGCSVQLSGKGK